MCTPHHLHICTAGKPVIRGHAGRRKDSMEVYKKSQALDISTLAPIGNRFFNRYLVDYFLTSPNSPQSLRLYESSHRTPSAYSLRAKQGYKYWMDEPYTYSSIPGKCHERINYYTSHLHSLLINIQTILIYREERDSWIERNFPRNWCTTTIRANAGNHHFEYHFHKKHNVIKKCFCECQLVSSKSVSRFSLKTLEILPTRS